VGLLVTLLLVAGKLLVETTEFGRQMQLMTYNLLQFRLESTARPDVVVVDIRRLETEGPPGRRITPRKPLLDLVAAIVEHEPRAIGLDIDMSPDEQGYMDGLYDPFYFREFLRIWAERCVPVFVGVHRTRGEDPEVWLGNEEFAPLAAAIVIPFDTRKMMQYILRKPAGPGGEAASGQAAADRPHQPSREAAGSCPVPVPDAAGLGSLDSLSHAAAKAYLAGAPRSRWLDLPALHWFVEPYSERQISEGAPYWIGEFFVDYGNLTTLKEGVLEVADPASIKGWRRLIEDRVVLLGHASGAEDRFVVPGHQDEGAIPGVFLHASAVQTLIDGPLYELTSRGRLFVDVAVSIGIIMAIAAIRFRYENARHDVHSHRLHGILTAVAIVMILIAAFSVVTLTRILWDDALLVVGVLLLHRPAERALERVPGVLHWVRIVWHRMVFQRSREQP
jgi:hypothetical protein